MPELVSGPVTETSAGRLSRLRFATGLVLILSSFLPGRAQQNPSASQREYFIDCSAADAGDGSSAHPWNSLLAAEGYLFQPGDEIELARGTVCRGSFSPQGSGDPQHRIRLTAYGKGRRPRIVAPETARQALLLFNQEFWQVDSLDISGGNTYGVFVSGDKGKLSQIHLKNLDVHDVKGGPLKNKDSGLVVVAPGKIEAYFDDVLVDGVVAAHTNQWAGILIGGGRFYAGPEAPRNTHVIVRNSSVHDVYGDGIILFRDQDSVIETSTAWETGMQPTETTGTPNAIWTWTCTDCTVQDNEAFLTDSPGVDGGAYDIDWANTRNTVQRNFAHDTQGYCFAVFAAGYVTVDSVVRDNLCIDNGLSPRLAALQGAVYLHTWNDGVMRNLRIEHNTIIWNPPVSSAAAIVNEATIGPDPAMITGNRIESSAPVFYRATSQMLFSANQYTYSGAGDAKFIMNGQTRTLADLQANGLEKGTTMSRQPLLIPREHALRLDATVKFSLDDDGLLAPEPRAQLMVLKSLAAQYGRAALDVRVHLCVAQKTGVNATARANALLDLDADDLHFDGTCEAAGTIRLLTDDGRPIEQWHGFQNAATFGLAVRSRLGTPRFSQMTDPRASESSQ
ncbi:MAG TPA: right-handed parallel beta-helix repeat-containing protein [Terracidiphilus sp.]|nr:right-handed parallel beta-helix repeat-containing protein [Terracidiphilus sp.]